MLRIIQTALLVVSIFTVSARSNLFAQARPVTGHQPNVKVKQATDLDWVYAFANQSLREVPARVLDGYASTEQSYELFVPPKYNARQSWPVVVFISPGNRPSGFGQWKTELAKQGVIFASPFQAGNGTATPKRVRIVMDVLAELRRNFNVNPDRTYIAGFSGGGRIASAIAFALPEYFGGVIPVCAGGDLRQEPALRHRVKDRLSIAHLTGSSDFNRGEVERMRHTMLTDLKYREKTWVVPRLGHGIPNAGVFAEAYQWLEADLPNRKKLAKQFPASSLAKSIQREEWAKLYLAEGRQRLTNKETLYAGLMQLHLIQTRWSDLPQAEAAKKILATYQIAKDQAWAEQDVVEQRAFLVARAKGVDAYASGDLPKQYEAQRKGMLQAAINLWTNIVQDGVDKAAVKIGKERIPVLKKLLDKEG
jgi:pimeloyl-ACP methyl ester carboxylesterase